MRLITAVSAIVFLSTLTAQATDKLPVRFHFTCNSPEFAELVAEAVQSDETTANTVAAPFIASNVCSMTEGDMYMMGKLVVAVDRLGVYEITPVEGGEVRYGIDALENEDGDDI